jgi:hypothetical protein
MVEVSTHGRSRKQDPLHPCYNLIRGTPSSFSLRRAPCKHFGERNSPYRFHSPYATGSNRPRLASPIHIGSRRGVERRAIIVYWSATLCQFLGCLHRRVRNFIAEGRNDGEEFTTMAWRWCLCFDRPPSMGQVQYQCNVLMQLKRPLQQYAWRDASRRTGLIVVENTNRHTITRDCERES